MKKVLFIDRDGTLVQEPPFDFQLDSLEKLSFIPGVFGALSKISKELDYELVMVTNQDGLGTASFPESDFWPAHNKIIEAFENEGIRFKEVLIDRSFENENSPNRKPGTGMLQAYVYGDYDLANSFVIGDRESDLKLALNLGAQGIFIGNNPKTTCVLATSKWEKIYQFLSNKPRVGICERTTKETSIRVEVNLDGNGVNELNSGLGFLDHMLEQISKHGNIDLKVSAKGDLEVDEHHSVKDLARALGTAFNTALGSKKGIARYGFLLPMDESLAQVALDFGGRAELVWKASFQREKIGDVPTEMFKHFFKSFCYTARCNLNIQVEGENEHHKIEAIFKAFARALKMAVQQTKEGQIPSTKGSL